LNLPFQEGSNGDNDWIFGLSKKHTPSPSLELPSGHKYFYVKMARRLGRLSPIFGCILKILFIKLNVFSTHFFKRQQIYWFKSVQSVSSVVYQKMCPDGSL